MYVEKNDFDALVNRVTALEERVDEVQDTQKQIANALAKLRKKDFNCVDIEERNWLIYTAEAYLKWSRKKIASSFNISESTICNVISSSNLSMI